MHGFKGWSETGQSGLLARNDIIRERARMWSHGNSVVTLSGLCIDICLFGKVLLLKLSYLNR